MTQIILDLPPALARDLEARCIDESRAKEIALAALRLSVEQGTQPVPVSAPADAASFARHMIEQNRPLFEELARL